MMICILRWLENSGTEVRDSDFKNAFPGIFNFTVGILNSLDCTGGPRNGPHPEFSLEPLGRIFEFGLSPFFYFCLFTVLFKNKFFLRRIVDFKAGDINRVI